MKTLGDKIRYYRNLNGWSQEDMAVMLEIAGVSLSNIERNVTDINYSRLKQIADLYKITVSELTDLTNKSAKLIELEKIVQKQEKEIIQLQRKLLKAKEKQPVKKVKKRKGRIK
ncbi:MAG TPA: helix-turn-helix transcriptional regulator [Bacteroidia bacterium]|jgi:transcriptional regulator with XRE-family HTH domain|nr:helix-turn-helix transcriptional regulator [Bacteroidia bacterium]